MFFAIINSSLSFYIIFCFCFEGFDLGLIYTRTRNHDPWVGHSYMYLITHLRQNGIYHGAIHLRNWNSLHPMSTNKYKFCHFRLPYLYL